MKRITYCNKCRAVYGLSEQKIAIETDPRCQICESQKGPFYYCKADELPMPIEELLGYDPEKVEEKEKESKSKNKSFLPNDDSSPAEVIALATENYESDEGNITKEQLALIKATIRAGGVYKTDLEETLIEEALEPFDRDDVRAVISGRRDVLVKAIEEVVKESIENGEASQETAAKFLLDMIWIDGFMVSKIAHKEHAEID